MRRIMELGVLVEGFKLVSEALMKARNDIEKQKMLEVFDRWLRGKLI